MSKLIEDPHCERLLKRATERSEKDATRRGAKKPQPDVTTRCAKYRSYEVTLALLLRRTFGALPLRVGWYKQVREDTRKGGLILYRKRYLAWGG